MRILSQTGLHDGIIDVPYEQVSIEQKENEIWVGYSSTMSEHCIGKMFAKYSTAEKAQKAMDMLNKKYMSFSRFLSDKPDSILPKVFKFPSEYEVDKALNESEE